jgi:transcriptional regulator with XRE-family HTH domain
LTRLEQLRIDARLTPEELGVQCGVSGVTIRNLEKGRPARVKTLGKIADYFSIRPSEVLAPVIDESAAA